MRGFDRGFQLFAERSQFIERELSTVQMQPGDFCLAFAVSGALLAGALAAGP